MSNQSIGLDEPLHRYLLDCSVHEPEILAELRQETARLAEHNMQIAPEQGQFMAWLVRLIDVHRYLEIGTFTGYSALAMALAMPPDGQIIACDISRQWTALARRYWQRAGVSERIVLHLRPALETLDELLALGQAESFDFVFIDADKAGYVDYFERALRLVRDGGLIAVDNTLWNGRVADPQDQDPDTVAIRAFNNHLRDHAAVDLSLVPIGDGLSLLRKRGARASSRS